MTYRYACILMPISDGYQATVPDLPGVVTFGATLDEAIDMAQDALSMALLTMEDEGLDLPKPSPVEDHIAQPQGVLVLLTVDTLRYRMQTDTKAVRKNVSMPAWMSTLADQRGLNCSQVLQEALRARFEETAQAPA